MDRLGVPPAALANEGQLANQGERANRVERATEGDLAALRAEIDGVDVAVCELLQRRIALAVEIGRIKRTLARAVHDASREQEVIARARARVSHPLQPSDVEAILAAIIAACRRVQDA